MADNYAQATQDALNEQKKQLTAGIAKFGSAANDAFNQGRAAIGQQKSSALDAAAHRAALIGGPEASNPMFAAPINASYGAAQQNLGGLQGAINSQLSGLQGAYKNYIDEVGASSRALPVGGTAGLSDSEIRTRALGAGTINAQKDSDKVSRDQKAASDAAQKAQEAFTGGQQNAARLQQQYKDDYKQLQQAALLQQNYEKAKKVNPVLAAQYKQQIDRGPTDAVNKFKKIVSMEERQLATANAAIPGLQDALNTSLSKAQDASKVTAMTPVQAAIQAAIAHGVSPETAMGLFAGDAQQEQANAQKQALAQQPVADLPSIGDLSNKIGVAPQSIADTLSSQEYQTASDEITKTIEDNDSNKDDFRDYIKKYAKKPALYKILKYQYENEFPSK